MCKGQLIQTFTFDQWGLRLDNKVRKCVVTLPFVVAYFYFDRSDFSCNFEP